MISALNLAVSRIASPSCLDCRDARSRSVAHRPSGDSRRADRVGRLNDAPARRCRSARRRRNGCSRGPSTSPRACARRWRACCQESWAATRTACVLSDLFCEASPDAGTVASNGTSAYTSTSGEFSTLGPHTQPLSQPDVDVRRKSAQKVFKRLSWQKHSDFRRRKIIATFAPTQPGDGPAVRRPSRQCARISVPRPMSRHAPCGGNMPAWAAQVSAR